MSLKHIAMGGLNERFAGTNAGAAFGDGIYLAEDAGKTDQYLVPTVLEHEDAELAKLLYSDRYPHPKSSNGEPSLLCYLLVCRACRGYPNRSQGPSGKPLPMDGQDPNGKPLEVFPTT